MRYAMLLKSHANVRYRQSLQKLALAELSCSLEALGLKASPVVCQIRGEEFLTFETDAMTEESWRAISAHSSICLAGELEGDALRVLKRNTRCYLPSELPQVLKYKGKTNADFTALMLRCALFASDFARSGKPLTVLDPLCGKATTLFCALVMGMNAIGVERDEKALREADTYLERCLQLHKLKYKRETSSRTMPKGGSARVTRYVVSDSPEHWKAGDTRELTMVAADAQRLTELVKPGSCHLVAADLPYGVQHAPSDGGRVSSLAKLAQALMPGCYAALKPGGAAAWSYNAYTLDRSELARCAVQAGLQPLAQPPYDDFRHWVEQAVERDMLVARREASITV